MVKFRSQEASLFSTPLWNIITEGIDNQELVDYAYYLQKNTEGVVISNRGGWHSNNFIEPYPNAIHQLMDSVLDFANRYCSQITNIDDLMIGNWWVNINSKGHYNEQHDHQGAILSAIYYAKVSAPNTGKLVLHRDDTSTFFLGKHRGTSEFSHQHFTVEPKEGSLVVFPAWTKHSVEQNESDTDRVSIAINIVPKK
tara:strand:+ start:5513 stop:6103 length:591 start_codon:yes stop_codon:yes gene_type:complete